MFEELQLYLSKTTSPEHAHILLQACKVLEDNGIKSVGDYLEEFMALVNTRSTEETLAQLHTLLINQYEIALNQFGIFLVEDELNLKTLTYTLQGIIDIADYDNPLVIYDICYSDTDPEEKLVDILQLTTPLSWDDLLNQFEGVSNNLIERIVSILPSLEENETVPKTEEFILNRVKKLISIYPNLWVLEEVDNGFIIGQGIDLYVNKFIEHYEQQETKLSAKHVALEYLGFTLLSKVPDTDVKTLMLEKLEDVLDDVVFLSKVSLEIDALSKDLLEG